MNDLNEVTIEFPVHFTRGAAGRKDLIAGIEPPSHAPKEAGRVPRVARLMALAIRFDDLVRRGEVDSYADLARLGHVTRARVTQIMDLLCLASDIQEEILFLPRVEREREAVSEHEVRPVCAEADWREQRKRWRSLRESRGGQPANMTNKRDFALGAGRGRHRVLDQRRDSRGPQAASTVVSVRR